MEKEIQEGQAIFLGPSDEKISRKLPVFYNPVMKLNRDITVALLNAVEMDDMQIADPMAGTGIRGIRMLLELERGKIRSLEMNDISPDAVKLIDKNLKKNMVSAKIHCMDANEFLLQSKGFDYIDIDPFGSPNKFLDSAIKRLARCGILAVTATDTSALAGTFPKACRRKYWATPLRTEIMHEVGLRILIRKVQLIGAQYDRALTPIYSYSKDHYMRVFFRSKKGKQRVDKILEKHSTGVFDGSDEFGPLWTGRLWDRSIAEDILRYHDTNMTRRISDEAKVDALFFYDIHAMKKRHKIRSDAKKSEIIKKLQKKHTATETHFSDTGLRTDATIKEFLKCLK